MPLRIRQGLNVESGLNDGGSVPFLTLFIGLAAAEEGLGGGWLRFAVEQIGYGTLIGVAAGVAGGVALRRAAARGWTVPLFEKLALAALAVIAFVAADEVGGNGFIAAFVGGGAAGMAAGPVTVRALDLAEEDGELLNLAVFFLFGVFASDALGHADAPIVAYAVLSLTLIRMLPVAVALIGLGLRPATLGFLGWFGPRGLASIILALVVVEDAEVLQGIDQIFVGDDGHGPAQRVRARHHRRTPQPALRRREPQRAGARIRGRDPNPPAALAGATERSLRWGCSATTTSRTGGASR